MLVQVLTRKPLVERKLDHVMERLREEQGLFTAVEAAAMVSMMEGLSKVSDATGRAPMPKGWSMVRAMRQVLKCRPVVAAAASS